MPPRPPSARRLQAAMAPGRRPNPPSKPAWQLQRRHAEGGPWFTVDRLWDEEGADDWAAGPTVTFGHGDLLRLLSPRGRVSGFWVQTLRGLHRVGRVPRGLGRHGLDWEAVWEGPGAKAEALLEASADVDRRRQVLAACDCAESALRYVPRGEARPQEAIETARRWTRGEASPEEATAAAEAAAEAAFEAFNASYAARAAAAADGGALATAHQIASAAYAARAAALAAAGSGSAALAATEVAVFAADRWSHGPLVRRWIPLPVVLLARAGEPTPLSLGF